MQQYRALLAVGRSWGSKGEAASLRIVLWSRVAALPGRLRRNPHPELENSQDRSLSLSQFDAKAPVSPRETGACVSAWCGHSDGRVRSVLHRSASLTLPLGKLDAPPGSRCGQKSVRMRALISNAATAASRLRHSARPCGSARHAAAWLPTVSGRVLHPLASRARTVGRAQRHPARHGNGDGPLTASAPRLPGCLAGIPFPSSRTCGTIFKHAVSLRATRPVR